MNSPRKSVILLSGGIDSAVTLALARRMGFEMYALSLDYGQRHGLELAAAGRIAGSLGVARHLTIKVDLRAIGGSALTDRIEVPKDRPAALIAREIPVTYVPARNTVFLSIALAWCEAIGARDIFLGVNRIDYSGYPDCRPAFIEQFERLAALATRAGVQDEVRYEVHTPLMNMNKAEIIRTGHEAGIDLSFTHSCYDPTEEGQACGCCDACLLRRRGFREAGIPDPTDYAR